MGLFDKFKKKATPKAEASKTPAPETAEPEKPQAPAPKTAKPEAEIAPETAKPRAESPAKAEADEEFASPGWDAIIRERERNYPGQTNPRHFASLISWRLGGPNPLDGVSVYDGGDYWHFVTFGLTELYEKEWEDKEYSGYGMEFTFKLKKADCENEENELRCVAGFLSTLAKLTFENGEIFNPYEYVYTGQTTGVDFNQKSNITGFITLPDDKFKEIDTPNGKVYFVEFVGATDRELKALYNKQIRVKELYEKIGTDVTSYNRKSVI